MTKNPISVSKDTLVDKALSICTVKNYKFDSLDIQIKKNNRYNSYT